MKIFFMTDESDIKRTLRLDRPVCLRVMMVFVQIEFKMKTTFYLWHSTVNSDVLTQFIEANDLIPMNGYLRQKTNQLPTFRGPNERVTRLDWILSKNIDKSHITKINNVMPKIVRSDNTVLIANIDIKWKRFSAKLAPKTDWSQLGNTDCRSRFVDKFQKSREEGQDFVNAVRYASNALPFKMRRSSYLWYDNPELDNAEGMIRAAPISMEFQVGSIPMLLQIWKCCMPQPLQRQPLRLWME